MLGPSGAGWRVTCRTDWGFLALYQRGKAKSGGGNGDGSVIVAHAQDGASCAALDRGQLGFQFLGPRPQDVGRGQEGSVAHGLVSTCMPVSPSPCGARIGVFTYIESLPTYNYRLLILPPNSWLPARSPASSPSLDAKFTSIA